MPALSTMDLAMFLLESRERPFNIGPLVLLRPPAGFQGKFADKLHARLLQRPPGPPFNYRLQLSLSRAPSVEPMADADIRRHVHRITLQQATREQLFEQVCALHETLLDRSGLLWQFYVIDGLDDGCVALYGKVHHGIIDGRAFVKAVTQWFAESPGDREVRAMWDGVPRAAGGGPKRAGLLRSLLDTGARATGMLRTAADMAGLLADQGLRSAGLGKGTRLPYLQVPGVFDGRLSARRAFAYCTLPLAQMKAIGKAHQATVNDLLLTVLDIAMQRYLAEAGKTPDTPLVVDMPVALADAKGGNQIAVLQFPLGRAAAGVAERLTAIRDETGQLKAALGARGSDGVMLYTTLLHALELLVERVAANAVPRLANVMVSNPYGLESERWLMGAAVELALPMSVVATGHKLNITAVTVGPRLQLGFLAMPEAVPQIGQLARYTEQAFDELARALGAPSAEPAPAKKKAAPRKPAAPSTARKTASKTAAKTAAPKTAPRTTKRGAKA